MNYYYITGTSRGIGKAFAEHLLDNSENRVIGISRKCNIEHQNYKHCYLDLTDMNAVSDFKFDIPSNAKKIFLINNAGSLGTIKPIGHLASSDIIKNYNLNLIAPVLLTNSFIQSYAAIEAEKVIVNMSSGAAKSPIDGWSVYCSSKAGLDMFSLVVDVEQKVSANKNKGFRIFSIAPGVVDTAMQEQIRTASKEDFSRLDDFIGYKINNQLANPKEIAEKYFKVLLNLDNITNVSFQIKEYN